MMLGMVYETFIIAESLIEVTFLSGAAIELKCDCDCGNLVDNTRNVSPSTNKKEMAVKSSRSRDFFIMEMVLVVWKYAEHSIKAANK